MMFGIKYDSKSFDGKNYFSIWQNVVIDILVQQGLFKALQDKKPKSIVDEQWEELKQK